MVGVQPLGALDPEENLTELGSEISRLPVTPRYGRILVEAAAHGSLEYFAIITAAIQARPLFLNRNKYATGSVKKY